MRRKNLKVSLIGIAILIVILLCACNSAEAKTEVEEKYTMEHVGYCDENANIEEWRDSETGVHYLVYDRKSGYGGMGGICPRYNADGTLYAD